MRYDSHCHLSPEISERVYHDSVRQYIAAKDFPINLMMTNHIDEEIFKLMLQDDNIRRNENVKLNVGIHPWFSHLYTFLEKEDGEKMESFKQRHYECVLEKHSKRVDSSIDELLYVLPDPISIREKIEDFEKLMTSQHGKNLNIGEIGLDKLARIPLSGFLCNPTTSITGLSNYKVQMSHQIAIFNLFLDIAAKYDKFCSIHCVGGHGQMYEILKESKVTKIVMHSYSGSVDSARMLLRLCEKKVWFGISDFVNFGNGITDKVRELSQLVKDYILVETDFGVDRMRDNHFKYVDEVFEKLAESGIDSERLWNNWVLFSNGGKI